MEAEVAPRVGKAELAALSALFVQEVSSAVTGKQQVAKLPKRLAERLVAKGWIEAETFTLGKDRFGVIAVEGYSLTHAGRYLYGENCPEEPE
jgi:hypothetical protein